MRWSAAFFLIPAANRFSRMRQDALREHRAAALQRCCYFQVKVMRVARAYHLIGQDSIDAIVIKVDEPIQALHLVLTHDAMLDDTGLLAESVRHIVAAAHLILEQVGILLFLCVLGTMSAPPLPAAAEKVTYAIMKTLRRGKKINAITCSRAEG